MMITTKQELNKFVNSDVFDSMIYLFLDSFHHCADFYHLIDEDKETLADAVLLVVGSKPWEVCNSLEMLYRVPGGRTAAIVSFATEKAAQELRDMFGDKVTAIVAAPYIPDPWAGADDALLRLYDMLLRPILEMEAPRELKDNNYKEEDLEAWYSENLQEIL